MNPNGADALTTLLEREQEERDRVRVRLRDAQLQADHALAQARQLQQYRAEYGQRWTQQFRQGGTIELVQCYQSFMQRLEQAVAQQQQLADQAAMRLESFRDAVRECEMRVASVRKLIERRERQKQRVAERADQRQSDESAQQLHARARAHRRAANTDTSWMM